MAAIGITQAACRVRRIRRKKRVARRRRRECLSQKSWFTEHKRRCGLIQSDGRTGCGDWLADWPSRERRRFLFPEMSPMDEAEALLAEIQEVVIIAADF